VQALTLGGLCDGTHAGFDAGATAREPPVSQERSEVVVIRAVDFSETSRIVTFLSPDRGKLACMAAGVRRPKSPLAGMLDTFNRLEVVYYWKDGRGVQKLGEATLLDGFGALKADLEKGAYAAFPLEFAYKTAQENEPSRAIYDTLLSGLEGMCAWTGPARVHAAWQVLQLLRVAGFDPDLNGEIEGKRSVGFSFDAGVTEPGQRADRSLLVEDLVRLRQMAEAQDQCPEVNDSPDVFQVLSGYAARQVECEFRSLRVIAQLFP
jgi:DNA repair protein RecO (recombination protein O)